MNEKIKLSDDLRELAAKLRDSLDNGNERVTPVWLREFYHSRRISGLRSIQRASIIRTLRKIEGRGGSPELQEFTPKEAEVVKYLKLQKKALNKSLG